MFASLAITRIEAPASPSRSNTVKAADRIS
ncbi:Uncharacterised protein [Mycobacteroides abscessus subsp. abscessus]|nr:Uncharacterised protein [Mycobacteroides abscessus subsp. abscessus]